MPPLSPSLGDREFSKFGFDPIEGSYVRVMDLSGGGGGGIGGLGGAGFGTGTAGGNGSSGSVGVICRYDAKLRTWFNV